jgi:hypothetical protein
MAAFRIRAGLAWQQISIALAILAAVFYFALQIPWVAGLFG